MSLYRPDASGFPPVHLNLSLYQDLLKNFPFGSGEEYQAFLNATSQSQTSTENSNATNQSPPSTHEPPLSSTFTNSAAGRPKGFWRNLSLSRKSYKVNPPSRRTRATQRDTCSIEMNHIFEPRSTGTTGNGPSSRNGTTTALPPSLPTSLVNENAQIGVDNSREDLNEIRVDAADN